MGTLETELERISFKKDSWKKESDKANVYRKSKGSFISN